MSSGTETDEVLSPPDVARLLGVGISTARRWIDRGVIPCSRTKGNHRRVTKADVLEFLEKKKLPLPKAWAPLRHRVLIIDDDTGYLRPLKSLLERADPSVELVIAESPIHGLCLACTTRPSVVLVDGLMPEVSGFEICQRLKQLPETADLKVIGFSGHAESEAAFRKAGADYFLMKPFTVGVVLELLRAMGVVAHPAGA